MMQPRCKSSVKLQCIRQALGLLFLFRPVLWPHGKCVIYVGTHRHSLLATKNAVQGVRALGAATRALQFDVDTKTPTGGTTEKVSDRIVFTDPGRTIRGKPVQTGLAGRLDMTD